jgi:hypothetical protein
VVFRSKDITGLLTWPVLETPVRFLELTRATEPLWVLVETPESANVTSEDVTFSPPNGTEPNELEPKDI